MTTPNAFSPEPLRALSPDFTKYLSGELNMQLQNEALEYFTDVAGEFAEQQWAAGLPDRQARWDAWSDQIIEPVVQAAPASFTTDASYYSSNEPTITFDVPFANGPRVSSVYTSLQFQRFRDRHFDLANEAHGDALQAGSIKKEFPNTSTLWVSRERTLQLADRVGYQIPLIEKSKTRILRRPVLKPCLDPSELVTAAAAREKEAIANVSFSAVKFGLAYGETVAGWVVNPTLGKRQYYTQNIEPNPYGLGRNELSSMVAGLSEEDRLRAANRDMDRESVIDRVTEKVQGAAEEATRRSKIADEVFSVIVASDGFKKIINA